MIQRIATYTSLLTSFFLLAVVHPLSAQVPRAPLDEYGKMDSILITVQQTGSMSWEALVYLTNDENIAALTLPLSWRPRGLAMTIDSATYTGLRTGYFALKTFFPDTTTSTVLIGLISDLGTELPPLGPGRGPIARLYFTSATVGQAPVIDTTFIRPHNVLQLVTPDVRAILPVFEVRNALAGTGDERH